jgi:hypothetical protein
MKKKILLFLVGVIIVFGLGTSIKADLILRGEDNLGHNLVYDTDLDITWYDFSHFSPEYNDAVIWVDQLSVRVSTIEFTDWRLPSILEGKGSNSGSPHYTEVEHLYLVELPNYQVLHPWAFPEKWRYFDNLPGGFYWIIQAKGGHGLGSEENRNTPAYNSYDRKLQFVPVSGVNRPIANRHTMFYNKNTYLGVAVHPGNIFRKLQKQQDPPKTATHQ